MKTTLLNVAILMAFYFLTSETTPLGNPSYGADGPKHEKLNESPVTAEATASVDQPQSAKVPAPSVHRNNQFFGKRPNDIFNPFKHVIKEHYRRRPFFNERPQQQQDKIQMQDTKNGDWNIVFAERDIDGDSNMNVALKILKGLESTFADDEDFMMPQMIKDKGIWNLMKPNPTGLAYSTWMDQDQIKPELKPRSVQGQDDKRHPSAAELEFENYVNGFLTKLSAKISDLESAIECLFWIVILTLATVIIYNLCFLICLVSTNKYLHLERTNQRKADWPENLKSTFIV